MEDQIEPLAFSIRRTAYAAQVSETFILKLRRTGQLRAVKVGRCWRIRCSEVLRLCGESNRTKGNKEKAS
jgi:excisionase family DNA binding protein